MNRLEGIGRFVVLKFFSSLFFHISIQGNHLETGKSDSPLTKGMECDE